MWYATPHQGSASATAPAPAPAPTHTGEVREGQEQRISNAVGSTSCDVAQVIISS